MGKCHVTMIWCEEINNLLDELEVLVSLFFLQYTFQSKTHIEHSYMI